VKSRAIVQTAPPHPRAPRAAGPWDRPRRRPPPGRGLRHLRLRLWAVPYFRSCW